MDTVIRETLPSEVLRARRADVLDMILKHGGSNPRVFGSVARGTDTPESDIDILIELPPERAWGFASVPKLSEMLGMPVDVVIESSLKPKHAAILREARPL